MMRPTTPSGSRTEKLIDVRTHRNRCTLHFRDKASEEFHLRRRDHRIADHFLDRIAAVCGVDHRQLIGVLAEDLRDPPQNLRALEWQDAPPLAERRLCRRNRGIDIGRPRLGDFPQRLPSAWIDRFDKSARLRFVPRAAVICAAVLRQHHGLCGSCLR